MRQANKPGPRQAKQKQADKKPAAVASLEAEEQAAPTADQLLQTAGSDAVKKYAALLSKGGTQRIQRQAMARQIGRRMGNRYLGQVLLQMKGDEERRQAALQQPPGTRTMGPPQRSEPIVAGGRVRQHIQVPFTQVIARADENPAAAAQEEPEPTLHVDEIPGEEVEVEGPEHDSSVTSKLGHSEAVSESGAAPSGYGITRCRWSIKDVDISSSFGTIFNNGVYTVKGKYHYDISWRVQPSKGPDNEVNIAGDSDPALKATNYQFVAKDLTPDMGDLNGRPPRDGYWAKDLTIRHELVHVKDYRRTGKEGYRAAHAWLGRQTSTAASHVKNTLLPGAIAEGGRVLRARMAAPPGSEQRAYGDGAPKYRARANNIKNKGDAGDFGQVSITVKVQPKGGDTHTVAPGDTLSKIAKKIYGDTKYWRKIRDANPGKWRDGGNIIVPGTVLDLPEIKVDQNLSLDLLHDTVFMSTRSVTVPGGASHEFVIEPKDLFTDGTNNSGTVTIDVVDDEFNTLKTVNWTIPGSLTHFSSDFVISAKVTS